MQILAVLAIVFIASAYYFLLRTSRDRLEKVLFSIMFLSAIMSIFIGGFLKVGE